MMKYGRHSDDLNHMRARRSAYKMRSEFADPGTILFKSISRNNLEKGRQTN